MRNKWVLQHNLADLRSRRGLSMEALAERTYTTSTTIFRIEKCGVITDPTLARTLASAFDMPFEDFCSSNFATEKIEENWRQQVERPYLIQPEPDSSYYLIFIKRYEKASEYCARSPTYWVKSEHGKERRRLVTFRPDGIREHLAEYDVRCAVVHDSVALIYYFYSICNNEERAALVRTDVADSVYPRLVKEYICETNSLPTHYDFKDLVELDLHGNA